MSANRPENPFSDAATIAILIAGGIALTTVIAVTAAVTLPLYYGNAALVAATDALKASAKSRKNLPQRLGRPD